MSEKTTSQDVAFDKIRDRLFKLMQNKAEAGDEGAKRFLEGTVNKAPDRRWAEVYKAGIKADLDRKSRTPPDGLTDDQRDVWLAGYDR